MLPLTARLSSDLRNLPRSFWKDCARWAPSFIQMKKGNTFTSLFPQSLPAKKNPHVCRQLKIGLSAWGNAQAQSHYQTKLSSDVELVYFWGPKKRGISSLCNWKLEKRPGAQRLGDYGKMSLSWTFSSLISHFAIFLFFCITQFSLSVFTDFIGHAGLSDFTIHWVYNILFFLQLSDTQEFISSGFPCLALCLCLGKHSVQDYTDWWHPLNCQSAS